MNILCILSYKSNKNMKTTKFLYLLGLFMLVSCISCSKEALSAENDKPQTINLPGTIYFHFAGRYAYINFTENRYVNEFANTKNFGKIDVSPNGKNILLISTKGISGTDHQRMIYRPFEGSVSAETISDGKNIFDFKYQWRNIGIGSGTRSYISPNGKFIAVSAESSGNHPITIIKAGRDETVATFRDDAISLREHKIIGWTNDNSLFVNVAGNIYKVNETNDWEPQGLMRMPSTHAAVNPQGTKLVFRAEKHLFMCNTNGSDVQQITTSKTMESIPEDGERLPTFSPDGKYIAFSAKTTGAAASWENPIDGSVVGTGSSYGYLAIIPADGKLYDLDAPRDGIVYPRSSDNKLIAVDGEFFWR